MPSRSLQLPTDYTLTTLFSQLFTFRNHVIRPKHPRPCYKSPRMQKNGLFKSSIFNHVLQSQTTPGTKNVRHVKNDLIPSIPIISDLMAICHPVYPPDFSLKWPCFSLKLHENYSHWLNEHRASAHSPPALWPRSAPPLPTLAPQGAPGGDAFGIWTTNFSI